MLDWQRLGKQRAETKQIFSALTSGGGWANHPAALMWRGHEFALLEYGKCICGEWQSRGYSDDQYDWFLSAQLALLNPDTSPPPWLGDERFHASHRAALLLKNPIWYSQFHWQEQPADNYYWPPPPKATATKVRRSTIEPGRWLDIPPEDTDDWVAC